MRITACLIAMLALCTLCTAGSTLRWEYYTVNGIDEIHVIDLDKDGSPEVYTTSWDEPTRPLLRAFKTNGEVLYELLVPRPALISYGEERMTYMKPADLDNDGVLDILAGSEIVSAGINSHRIYRFERVFEEDLKRYRTDMLWYVKTGQPTGIVLTPSETNADSIYLSSIDLNLRMLDTEGNVEREKQLSTSIYDISPVDYAKGKGLVAAAYQHLYGVDTDFNVLWDYQTTARFNRVYVKDVDKDGVDDVFAASENVLYRFTREGNMVWSRNPGDITSNIYSADVDNDNIEEIIVGVDKKAFVYAPNGKVLLTMELDERPDYVYAYDLSGNGTASILFGLRNGLKVYDASFLVNETKISYEEAIDLLSSAREESLNNNHRIALSKAEKAKEFFISQNDVKNIEDCDAIIERSQLAISAGEYYDQSVNNFDSGFYDEAMSYDLKALGFYQSLGISEGVEKALALNNTIFYSLYGASNVTLGDFFYRKAEHFYISNNFDVSAEYARNSSMYYSMAGEQTGLAKAENLLRLALEKYKPPTTTILTTTTIPVKKVDYMDYALVGGVIVLVVILFLALRKQ